MNPIHFRGFAPQATQTRFGHKDNNAPRFEESPPIFSDRLAQQQKFLETPFLTFVRNGERHQYTGLSLLKMLARLNRDQRSGKMCKGSDKQAKALVAGRMVAKSNLQEHDVQIQSFIMPGHHWWNRKHRYSAEDIAGMQDENRLESMLTDLFAAELKKAISLDLLDIQVNYPPDDGPEFVDGDAMVNRPFRYYLEITLTEDGKEALAKSQNA